MKNLAIVSMILSLLGCGTAPGVASLSVAPFDASQCYVVDQCTYADVPGYQCMTQNFNQEYKGHTCVTTKEDTQTDPSCDSNNPNQMCSGWNGPAVPCCRTIQGPGPAFVLN